MLIRFALIMYWEMRGKHKPYMKASLCQFVFLAEFYGPQMGKGGGGVKPTTDLKATFALPPQPNLVAAALRG